MAEHEDLIQRTLASEVLKLERFYNHTAKTKRQIEAFLKLAEQSGLIVQKPIETLCECDFLPENDILCCVITSALIDEEHLEYEKTYASYGYRWKIIEPLENQYIYIELYLTLDELYQIKLSTNANEVANKIQNWLVGVYKAALQHTNGKHHIHKDE